MEGRLVVVPGGRDREGRPLILISSPQDLHKPTLTRALDYALKTLSDETRSGGVTIVVDAQRFNWRSARALVRHLTSCLDQENVTVLVVRPELFWDKRVDNCTRIHRQGEPVYLPLSRLGKFVDSSQLTEELGGSLNYDHEHWVLSRLRVDRFERLQSEVECELDRITRYLNLAKEGLNNGSRTMTQTSVSYNNTVHLANLVLNDGRTLLEEYGMDRITEVIGQDVLDTRAKVEKQLSSVQAKLHTLHQAWSNLNKSIIDAKEVSKLEGGVRSVTEWLLATGEALLTANVQVGYDIASAEQLRRDHEALELTCRETYGHYAELLHKLDQCSQNGVSIPEDLKSQRDFMDFVCRSFATRLERRRNILITSARFFRLVSEYFQTTSEVYESVVMSADLRVLEKAHSTLVQLQESQSNIDLLEEAVVREGEKLSDLLAMPVKDALGRELEVDYQADILNIQEILEMTQARSELFRDSLELQRITLRQASHVYQYEKDAAQALEWLEDLFQVMLKFHSQVGCNVLEIQRQKEDHQAFQDTAKGTYEYGCQLLNAALSLRQHCKLSEDDNIKLCNRLRDAWQRLQSAAHLHMTRLRVTAVLHRTLNQNCMELRSLMEGAQKGGGVSRILQARERLLMEVGRMLRLARLLKSRLREPLCPQQPEDIMEWNRSAVDAISERVAEVTALAEELDAALTGGTQERLTDISKLLEVPHRSPTQEEWYGSLEKRTSPLKEESSRSEEEFATASECTCTPPSRSSSYHTASEGEPSNWYQSSPQEVASVVTQEVRETRFIKLSREGCSFTTEVTSSETIKGETLPIRKTGSASPKVTATEQTDGTQSRFKDATSSVARRDLFPPEEDTNRDLASPLLESSSIPVIRNDILDEEQVESPPYYQDIARHAITGVF